MMHYFITSKDYKDYMDKKPGNRVELIWADLISRLPESYKSREEELGFSLILHPSIKEDTLTKTFLIIPVSTDRGFRNAISKLDNIVTLEKD